MSAQPGSYRFQSGDNPLLSDSASDDWHELIEAVGPASLLLIIDDRMSTKLKHRLTPEDILQEALLHAWRDRANCRWEGLRSFRSWLLTIIDRRIQYAAAYESAQKRGGGRPAAALTMVEPSGSQGTELSQFAGPVASTTPSRAAIVREEAAAIREALDSLPPELREVLWLRLFEQMTLEQIAQRLGIGEAAVRHRVRKGSELYRRCLAAAFSSRSLAPPRKNAPEAAGDSSP